MAFLYDPEDQFDVLANPDSIVWQQIQSKHWESVLKAAIEEHVERTRSQHAESILNNWELELSSFKQIVPKELLTRLTHPLSDTDAIVAAE